MRRIPDHKYAHISSFDDFWEERQRLIFRRKLSEAKLNLSYLKIMHFFSISTVLYSVVKDTILPASFDLVSGKGKKDE